MRRDVAALALAAATLLPVVAACSHSGSNQSQSPESSSSASGQGKHGPMFPQCGGVSDETVNNLTKVTGLVNTAKNSVGCQWLAGGGILGPHFSFSWYRGSPIGRERKTEELHGASVNDIDIDGHKGFVAVRADPKFSDYYCDIGIQYQDDFIDWSISVRKKPSLDLCNVAKELSRQSIAAAT